MPKLIPPNKEKSIQYVIYLQKKTRSYLTAFETPAKLVLATTVF